MGIARRYKYRYRNDKLKEKLTKRALVMYCATKATRTASLDIDMDSTSLWNCWRDEYYSSREYSLVGVLTMMEDDAVLNIAPKFLIGGKLG